MLRASTFVTHSRKLDSNRQKEIKLSITQYHIQGSIQRFATSISFSTFQICLQEGIKGKGLKEEEMSQPLLVLVTHFCLSFPTAQLQVKVPSEPGTS